MQTTTIIPVLEPNSRSVETTCVLAPDSRLAEALGETLGRVVEAALADENISFRMLAEAAGLDPARDFVGASLVNVDFRDEDLRGFNFAKADLTGADFRRANIEGVSFDGA